MKKTGHRGSGHHRNPRARHVDDRRRLRESGSLPTRLAERRKRLRQGCSWYR